MTENDPTRGAMNDAEPNGAAHEHSSTPGRTDISAGAMLRQMREAAGVHAAVLASVLKVPQQKLEALENDRLGELPDVTFARGLAAAICRAFGTDPAPILARMPAASHGLRAKEADINQTFRSVGDRPKPMLSSGPSKPLMIIVGLLLLGAALLWLLPTLPIQLGAPATNTTTNADGSVSETVTPGPPVAAVEPSAPAEQPAAAASSAMQTTPAPSGQVVAPAPSAPASAAQAADSADQLMVITATAETWVTVRDAAGKPVINRALAAGETVSANGAVPLNVTIGRKDAVSVKVRGKPFDLSSTSRSNVARFQVQ